MGKGDGMRKPRDLDQYMPAKDAARFLRDIAKGLVADQRTSPLIKLDVKVGYWNPKWASKKTGGDRRG